MKLTGVAVLLVATTLLTPKLCNGESKTKSQVQVSVSYRPLIEVAQQLQKDTTIPIKVDSDIQQWKTSIVYQGKLTDLLDLICENFGLSLSFKENPARYRLYLSDAERLRLSQRKQKVTGDVLTEQERRRIFMGQRLRNLLDRIDKIQDDPTSQVGRDIYPGSKPLLKFMGSFGPQIIDTVSIPRGSRTVSDGQTVAVAKTASFSVSFNALTGDQQTLIRDYLQQQRGLGVDATGVQDEQWQDAIQRLDGSMVQIWNLEGRTLFVSIRFPGMNWKPDFPVMNAFQPPPQDPQNRALVAQPKGHQTPTVYPQDDRKVELELEDADYGQVVKLLSETTHSNVVADAFTLWERITAAPKNASLRDTLARVEKAFGLKHQWKTNTLLIRSVEWEDRQDREPPAAVLDKIIPSFLAHDGLSLVERIDLVSHLTDGQLGGLAAWHNRRRHMRPECSDMISRRNLYSWFSCLSVQQLDRMLQTKLPARDLAATQLKQLLSQHRAGTDILEMLPDSYLHLKQTEGMPVQYNLEVLNPQGFLLTTIE